MDKETEKLAPTLRVLELLDQVCATGEPFSLMDAVRSSGWPKPSVHRMLTQLEAGGLLAREPGSRLYTPAPRLTRLAENVLLANTRQGLRHAVLRQLVNDVGESCNLTALSGTEVIYLDRVEAAFPLRMELKAGTRVPIHCSASGKLFLAHMPARQRQALLDTLPLTRYTPTTLIARASLEEELAQILRQGYAVDAEEFVEGLVCAAVPVKTSGSRAVRSALALQAPAARMSLARAVEQVPQLHAAATAMARTLG